MLAVAHILGLMTAYFGLLYLLPIAWSLGAGDGLVDEFAIALGVNAAVGLGMALATRRFRRELKPRDGFILVALAWTLMSASAALPLMLVLPDLSFTDAYFEAASGLTTTGATVINGLDTLPPSVNIWRHTMHWIGGIGIIVLALAVLPLLGVGGMQLYKASTPGPVKDEKLTPRITETAKALWFTYLVLTVGAVFLLRVAGMDWLDAICHGFSAISLGGFSTRDANVGAFDSAVIEVILIVIMLVGATNFSRHFLAMRNLSLRPYARDSEGKAVLTLLGCSAAFVTIVLWLDREYSGFADALRHGAFSVVSIATTAGFVTENYEVWPAFLPVWLLFLSCITCSTGSTGSGIKMFRTLLLVRHARRELKLMVHPNAVMPIRIGGHAVPDRIVYSVLAFIFLYFIAVVVFTFAMLATGMDFLSSFSAVIASINNMGPALGTVGPSTNFAGLSDVQTWICAFAMLLGRLEIISVVVLFTATFWRK